MENNLYRLRASKNLTQKDMAKVLQVSQGSYQKYETGETEPKLKTLIELADYYDVSLDYLLNRPYSNTLGFLNEFDTATVQNFLQLNAKNKMQASSYIAGLLFAQ